MDQEILAFSESQQHAIIGHALQQPAIWSILKEFGIDEKWTVSHSLADTWKHLSKFTESFGRPPCSINEIESFVLDDLLNSALRRSIAKCVESKKKHPWDVLEKKLVDWAKARVVFTDTPELVEKYNAGKHKEAFKILQDCALKLEKINAISGLEPDGFVSVGEGWDKINEKIENDVKRAVPYSVPFLQDALKGIFPTEVILLGATSGAGKTEIAKIQAAHVARMGLPVHYFALEAEPDEIKIRLKYGIMGAWYKQDHPGTPSGIITYQNYRWGKLRQELDPYEDRASEEEKKYKTLHCYYRKRNDFSINTLERELLKLKDKSRLIVIDHIHFIDLETDNETREMSDFVKKVRQLAMTLEIPIICIAHINKSGNRNMGLIPCKEDFYGASNLFKTATTAIMMAPCRGMISSDPRALGIPTFMRVVKSRIDNSVGYETGISFFNRWTSDYNDYYSIGRLERGDKKWKSLKTDLPPWVDLNKNIIDVSDVE